jgi:hypothetical protein
VPRAPWASAVEPRNRIHRQLAVEVLELFEVALVLGAAGEPLEADHAAQAGEPGRLAPDFPLDRAGGDRLKRPESLVARTKPLAITLKPPITT